MTSDRGRRTGFASCFAICLVASPALAQNEHFAIPAQSADTAIDAIARQANIQIVASRTALRGRQTNAVQGNFAVREALDRLLRGTGLGARQTGAQIFAIVVVVPPSVAIPSTSHPKPVASQVKTPRIRHTSPEIVRERIDPIVVTGSLVISNGSRAPSPVTVMTARDMFEIRPAGIIEALNTLPALQGSINLTSNVNTGEFNMLNLRGMGSTRGLIMIDGNRVGSTQQGGQVDVDVIPQMLLSRVDIVTGGASAAYGSDAVSGVVNFVTDTKFTGFKADLRGGISRYDDDRKLGLAAAWGARFADGRGHVEIGYEYSDTGGFTRASRPFFSPWVSIVGSGTATSPYTLARGTTMNSASFGGLINSGPLAGLQFAQNGVLRAFNPGMPTASAGVNIGGDGAYFTGSTAGAAQRVHRSMARLDYQVGANMNAHVSGIFSAFKQSYTQQNPLLSAISIGYDNAYLANVQPSYQAIITTQPAGSSFQFSKLDLALPSFRFDTLETYYSVNAGLDGKLGPFEWRAAAYRTASNQLTRNINGINLQHLYAALNTVTVGAGKTVCHAALSNAAYAGCVPLDIFGPTADQPAAIAYVEQSTQNGQHFVTDDVNLALRGRLFDLPAGSVKVALMAEWRRNTYDVTTNASPTDFMDCRGIDYNCLNNPSSLRYLGGQMASLAPVSQTVTEQAVEVDVPVLADTLGAPSLSLNGALRHTYYDTSGAVWPWKAGAVWAISDALTLRVTRSRDIRAPNLYDLFSPLAVTTANYTDLHTNTSGVVTQYSQGNPALKPEMADTVTVGAVIKPRILPGLSLAIDFYAISVHQALVNISGFQPTTQAACEESRGTSPFCSFYVRPNPFGDISASNYPTLLFYKTLNVASLFTHGADIEVNYTTPLLRRNLTIRALLTYQPSLRYDNGAGAVLDVGGAADGIGGLPPLPSIKLLTSASYNLTDKLRITAIERWRSSLRQHGNASLIFAQPSVPSVGYTDLAFRYRVDSHLDAYLNIQNLFNTWPPAYGSAGGSVLMNYLGGYAQGDDIEGRYVTLGLKMHF